MDVGTARGVCDEAVADVDVVPATGEGEERTRSELTARAACVEGAWSLALACATRCGDGLCAFVAVAAVVAVEYLEAAGAAAA